MLEYIFYLGIVYTSFNLIWFLIKGLYKGLRGIQEEGEVEYFVLKTIFIYFIASLTALKTVKMGTDASITHAQFLPFIGAMVLYFYLVGKLKRQVFRIQVNRQMFGKVKPRNPKVESSLILVALIFFTVSFNFPLLVDNELTQFMMGMIDSVYSIPVIGWVIAIIAFFFLLSMLFRGVNATLKIIASVLALITGNKEAQDTLFRDMHQQDPPPHSDDDFDDFEIVEDDDEETEDEDDKRLEE